MQGLYKTWLILTSVSSTNPTVTVGGLGLWKNFSDIFNFGLATANLSQSICRRNSRADVVLPSKAIIYIYIYYRNIHVCDLCLEQEEERHMGTTEMKVVKVRE